MGNGRKRIWNGAPDCSITKWMLIDLKPFIYELEQTTNYRQKSI